VVEEGDAMTLLDKMTGFLNTGVTIKRDMRDRINLISAAEKHVLLKVHLGHHVYGRSRETLDSSIYAHDGLCQLGSWINGWVFEPFRESDAYKQLSHAHQQFHELGATIIEKLQAGDRGGAEAIFRNEYSQSLHHIIQALTEINKLPLQKALN